MIEREDQLEGRRLALDDRFAFRCGPDLDCFNSCCRQKRLPLFPYDFLRLRRALGVESQELLARFVELEIDPGSGWPALRLKLQADGRCHFVTEKGCGVYPHRPACCRIFPLARAVALEGGELDELFLAQETPYCHGWQEQREITVEQYLEEQELLPYRTANNRILRLLLHPARRSGGAGGGSRQIELDERQTHAFIMALYNLDVFRQQVAQAGFAARFGVPEERVERALSNDEDLLDLGQDWVTKLLFG
jgi:Fe-S-cluster containining protein